MNILPLLETETCADKSYGSHKYCFDSISVPSLDYDDSFEDKWIIKQSAETTTHKKSIDLRRDVELLNSQNVTPLFKYFLDGSRRTYKVDDVAYENIIYPIVAGQIGVACCERTNPNTFNPTIIELHNVISMPLKANASSKKSSLYFNELCKKINDLDNIKRMGLNFSFILTYKKTEKSENYENLAIAEIQNKMIDLEKTVVANLVSKKLLNDDAYLIKDGSLEYKNIGKDNNKEAIQIKNNYRYVIGVSKKFNPEIAGEKNITQIAELPLYHRSPAIRYQNYNTGNHVSFCVWYLRIRDRKYSASPFDGIVKVEKILVTDEENENGLDSEVINNISAHLINERNPVCYGSDNRWANHIYPIHLTEKYIKSKYLSDIFYLNLF